MGNDPDQNTGRILGGAAQGPLRHFLLAVGHWINHDLVQGQQAQLTGDHLLEMRAMRPVAAREEVFMSYGPSSIENLLVRYGFVDPQASLADAYHRMAFQEDADAYPADCTHTNHGPLICGVSLTAAGLESDGNVSTCVAGHPNRILKECAGQLLNTSNYSIIMAWTGTWVAQAVLQLRDVQEKEPCQSSTQPMEVLYQQSRQSTLQVLERTLRLTHPIAVVDAFMRAEVTSEVLIGSGNAMECLRGAPRDPRCYYAHHKRLITEWASARD